VSPADRRDDGPERARVFAADEVARVRAKLPGPALPWGSGAMLPAGLSIVMSDVAEHDRRRVVELGSGLSTILLARLLAQRNPPGGSRLVAVEHDAAWASWVIGQLACEGTHPDVVIVHVPLRPHPSAAAGLDWYDGTALAAGLDAAMHGDPVDLLIIDGPPAYADGHELARYPALPVMRPRLAPGATVILDDVERAGEQEVLRRWERETGLAFDRHPEAGVAMAMVPRRGG
jgi:predicted O-methyltransferase YrrM